MERWVHELLSSRPFSKKLFLVIVFLIISCSGFLLEQSCSGSPCMYGICLENDNSSYSCYCIDGYTGINCEINWDDCWSDPCYNGGTCSDAVATYNCTCPEGFVGVNCEQKYSECSNQPCLNNGTCLDYDGFICQCPDGYSGDYCEIDASVCNDTICKNSGECIEGPGFSFLCRCPEGWTGRLCDQDVDECLASPCKNGGLCINVPSSYTCACLFGFTGKDCDKAIIPCAENPCENGAVCLLEDEKSICYCVPDYHGPLCEFRYDDCESKFVSCENGGTCIDGINSYTCVCPDHFIGDSCEKYDASFSTVVLTEETLDFNISHTTESTVTLSSEPSYLPTSLLTSSMLPTDVTQERGTSRSYTDWYPFTEIKSLTEEGSTDSFRDTESSLWQKSTSVKPDTETKESNVIEPERSTISLLLPTKIPDSSEFTSWTTSLTSTESELESTAVDKTMKPLSTIMDQITEGSTVSMELIDTTLGNNTSTMGGEITSYSTSKAPYEVTKEKTNISTVLTSPMTAKSFMDTTTPLESLETNMFTTFQSEKPLTLPATVSSTQIAIDTRTPEESLTKKECDCSHRDECRTLPSITDAAFNGKSFARHRVNVVLGSGSNATLQIYLALRTQFKNGIILHAYFDDKRYALVYLEQSSLKFQFSCGLDTMLLGEIDSPIDNGFQVHINVTFQFFVKDEIEKCSAKLLVNGTTAVSGEQLSAPQINIPHHASLHLGGIPLAFSHYFPHVAMGFVGCMSSLKVNGVTRHFIYDSLETFQIEECTSFLCLSNPCQNFGACIEVNDTVRCRCIAGYTGVLCERSACDDNPCSLGATCISSPGTGFVCVCPLGTHGLLCEEDIVIARPSFSIIVPGFSSYIAYGVSNSIKDSMELKMRLIPRTVEQISLIAYLGQSGSRRDISDHLSITYVRGYIMLTWDLGSGVRRIFTSSPLGGATTSSTTAKNYKPHTVRVGRRGKDVWLAVEGLGNVTGRTVGSMTRLDVSPILYIGGHKSRNFEALPHDLPLHSGFSGCIFDIELRTRDTVFPISSSSPAIGRGVGECHQNECIHHTCKNGAVCLNHGPTYSCICTKDWMGPTCATPAEIRSSLTSSCQMSE